MMKKPDSLSGIIESFLLKRGWRERVNRERVLLAWNEVVGDVTAAHAQADDLHGAVLLVKTDTPAWSHTLSLMKVRLLTKLRDHVPNAVIKDIRFICADDNESNSTIRRGRRSRR